MKNLIKVSFLIFATTTACVTPKAATPVKATNLPALESFEFLGCSGDWNEQSAKADIWRLSTNNRVNYLVRHPGTCGLEGRKPKAIFANGSLDLTYGLFSAGGPVVMCECEYWARFTFGESALQVRDVTFNGQSAEKRGEWPSGL